MDEGTDRVSGNGNTTGRRQLRWGWFLAGLLLLLAAIITASIGTCSQAGGVPVCQPDVPRPASLALAAASLYPFWRAFTRR